MDFLENSFAMLIRIVVVIVAAVEIWDIKKVHQTTTITHIHMLSPLVEY